MGNCLRAQKQIVKVVKMDGKILEYRAPIKVHQVLSNFTGHAIADILPASGHLQPNTELVGGRFYYLVPLQMQPSKVRRKKVSFLNLEERGKGDSTGLRVKLVIRKQELMEMIENGVISVNRMASQPQNEENENGIDVKHGDCHRSRNSKYTDDYDKVLIIQNYSVFKILLDYIRADTTPVPE
ncbi:hypothetical protein Ancab_014308 [Ancistrocladus abbreviatus]